jgi:DNA-binding Lrp family transcriptional regulator
MKDIKPKLIRLFKEGYCTPQISRIAKTINEPSGTISYNIKRLEEEGTIKTYKAVFDYSKIEQGFCAYVLINVPRSVNPRQAIGELAKHEEIESMDILAGEWDLILKVRTKDQNSYYCFLEEVINQVAIERSRSLVSLGQVKENFMLT